MFVVRPVKFGDDLAFALNREASERAAVGQACINATVGVLVDDDGQLAVMPTVSRALRGLRPEEWAGYAGTTGLDEFSNAVTDDCFAPWPGLRRRAIAVATPGATGAIRNALVTFLERDQAFLTSSLCWGAYAVIAREADRRMLNFRMLDESRQCIDTVDFERKLSKLMASQGRALILLNDPCHNPTGYSMSMEDWVAVAAILRRHALRGPITLVLDAVYAAYSPRGIRHAMNALEPLAEQVQLVVAWSASKSFTSYGLRVGALVAVAPNPAEGARIRDTLAHHCCGTWANCNRGGLVAVARLLTDPVLREELAQDRSRLINLLARRRAQFALFADPALLPYPACEAGFFVSVFVRAARRIAASLRSDGIYVVPVDGALRLALSAVRTTDVPRLVRALESAVAHARSTAA